MNNDDLEKEIANVIKGKISEPEEYKIAIENALYTNDKKLNNNYLYKMIATICCALALLSGIVYASYSIIQNVFNNRKGFQTAIDNNYIMDGLETYQESNGVSVKINNMLIDDYNIGISFNIKFDNESKLKLENIESFEFEKMIILDEENRVLFNNKGNPTLNNFLKNNHLDINIDKFNESYVNATASSETRNIHYNQLDLIYNLTTNEQSYPKSKEIVIYVENINLNGETTIKGIWQIKQKIENKFYNREKITYNCKNDKDKNIISMELETYATGTNLKLELEINNASDKNLIEKLDEIEGLAKNNIKNDKNDSYKEITSEIGELYKIFKDVYIENENGIKFSITNSVNENRQTIERENKIIYNDTLDMTIYDCTSKIILHFIYEDEEYNIELFN